MVETYSMAENILNVRAKTIVPRRRIGVFVWMFVGGTLLVVTVAATLGFDAYSGKIGIFTPRFEIIQNGAKRVIKVPPGGNVQAAIEQTSGGDIVELQAGAVYFGEIKLPNKPLTDFVTIQSSAAANLASDKRVGPDNSSLMARIVSRGGGKPAVSASSGANHYRFVGIEFTVNNADYVYNLVLFGNGETAGNLPHDLEIDRCYLHPFKTGAVRRGIALNSAATTIKNSYIEGFGFSSEEAQGICGWTGTRNVKIINNYIEGGAENIMFGGSDPASADLIPADIEIRGNHLSKPAAWIGKATMKTLFELKDAKRVQFTGNYLENNWVGSAFRITVRNDGGKAEFSTLEDVVIKDNIINGSGAGINILGRDDIFPSQTMKRLTITNNLFLNIGSHGYEGSGYFIQVGDGENITIANNTSLNLGNIATFHNGQPKNFIFRDNITGHGEYGIHDLGDLKSPQARAMFQNNVFVNLNHVPASDYAFPPGNTIIGDVKDVGFVNPVGNDYRLGPGSKYKGKGSDISATNSSGQNR